MFPLANGAGGRKEPDRAVAARWAERKAVSSNSPVWRYLRRQRGLSSEIIEVASVADVLREGPVGSACFPISIAPALWRTWTFVVRCIKVH
jgi:hypothetical protein